MNQADFQSSVTATDTMYRDVVEGLALPQKRLHCKYFYDERGSRLFDQICELDEYYLTRTERSIIDQYVQEMSEQLGAQVQLVEFGSGSSTKTRILLDHLCDPVAYVPVDISVEHLHKTAAGLRKAYPHIEILPVAADFTQEFELPQPTRPASHAAIFFPGSTIGNFTRTAAVETLRRMSRMLGPQGGLLIGIDLQKDPEIIEAAYNDADGITDEFNLNLLHRLNRELDADFEVDEFRHDAVYDEAKGRVEISVVSCQEQVVTIGDRQFRLDRGERILTEYSHKYTVSGFAKMAESAGFSLHRHWTDPDRLFAVLHLVRDK